MRLVTRALGEGLPLKAIGLPIRLVLAFLAGSLVVGVVNAFNNYTVSLWLTQFTASYAVIAVLGNSRSLGGAVVSPLAGAWSDRTWLGWLGRRRPFTLVGGLLTALLLALTPVAARNVAAEGVSPEMRAVLPAATAILLYTLVFNLLDDLQKALLSDLTRPGEGRNTLSGLTVVVDIGAQVAILALGALLWSDGIPDWAFLFVAALVTAGVLTNVLGVREPSPSAWAAQRGAAVEHGAPASVGAWDYRPAAVYCLVTMAYWSGVNAILPLLTIYLRDELGATAGEAQLLPALLLLTTAAMAVPVGKLGTRVGKRRVLAAGYTVMGVGALLGLVVQSVPQGAVVLLLAGLGNSATIVLAIPLMADLVPRHRMGLAAGSLATSSSLAAPFAGFVSGSLAESYGPRVIFAVMAAMTGAALLLIPGTQQRATQDSPVRAQA